MSYTINLATGIVIRIAAVSAQIYWATWRQVFRYQRGDE